MQQINYCTSNFAKFLSSSSMLQAHLRNNNLQRHFHFRQNLKLPCYSFLPTSLSILSARVIKKTLQNNFAPVWAVGHPSDRQANFHMCPTNEFNNYEWIHYSFQHHRIGAIKHLLVLDMPGSNEDIYHSSLLQSEGSAVVDLVRVDTGSASPSR